MHPRVQHLDHLPAQPQPRVDHLIRQPARALGQVRLNLTHHLSIEHAFARRQLRGLITLSHDLLILSAALDLPEPSAGSAIATRRGRGGWLVFIWLGQLGGAQPGVPGAGGLSSVIGQERDLPPGQRLDG